MAQEVAAVHAAQADGSNRPDSQGAEHPLDGLGQVPRGPDDAGEHVRHPAGQNSQGGARADQSVGHLVDCAVAPQHHDRLDAGGGGLAGQGGGVSRSSVRAMVTSWASASWRSTASSFTRL